MSAILARFEAVTGVAEPVVKYAFDCLFKSSIENEKVASEIDHWSNK